MASIEGGGRRRCRRRTRGHSVAADFVDDNIGVGYTEGHSFSSDEIDYDTSGRNKVLDDALFGLFTKQAVRNLKRKFSDVCQDMVGTVEVNKRKPDGIDTTHYTRYGPKYFVEVVKKLTSDQRAIIEKFGFQCLLLFDCCYVPSVFARWVADCIDPICSLITVCDKSFLLSKDSFHVVLGLPTGGMSIPVNSGDGKNFILSHFQLSDMPHITFFGNKLSGGDPLGDLDVFVCFMAVALSCFLCPCLNESVNPNHLSVLKDPAAARKYDFSKLVYEHYLSSLCQFSSFRKSRGRRMNAPICCNYALAVRYLDFLEFGIQNVDQTTPRVLVWRGNMIKKYSELDSKGFHQFGKKRLKDGLCGYFPQDSGRPGAMIQTGIHFRLSPLSNDFKISAHTQFVDSIPAGVIDGIVSITDKFISNNPSTKKPKMDVLLSSVLEFLSKTSVPHKKVDSNIQKQLLTNRPDANMTNNQIETGVVQQKATPTPVAASKEIAYATPDCMITKVVEAPAVNPIKKVKARRCKDFDGPDPLSRKLCTTTVVNGLGMSERNNDLFFLSRDPPDCGSKQPQAANDRLRRLLQSNGSIKSPIRIDDMSPNPPMNGNSEGAEIVGSSDFRRRRVELAKETDNTYNRMMLSNQPAGGVQQENVEKEEAQGVDNNAQIVAPVRVKYRFVNWLVSKQSPPLPHNSRYPVSQEQIIDYSAMVELAHSSHETSPGVQYQKVHCSYKSLGRSLMPNGEIDNFIIPVFCRLLFEERHPSSSGKHYFFPHIGEAILKYAGPQQESTVRASFEGAAKASKSRNLGHKNNKLFFPIVNSGHWISFTVDFEHKLFVFLDSLYDKDSPFHLRVKDRLIDNFVHLWEIIVNQNHNFGDFQAFYPDVPKQQTLKDCGVFVMKFMEDWDFFTDMRTVFSYHDVLNLRILYANRLYFFSQNEVNLSLVTEFYAKG